MICCCDHNDRSPEKGSTGNSNFFLVTVSYFENKQVGFVPVTTEGAGKTDGFNSQEWCEEQKTIPG